MKPKSFNFEFSPAPEQVLEPCVNLGTRIARQMYNGVDPNNSTLVHGEYDDEDSWDVDPAVDMSADRFELNVDNSALHQFESPSPDE